MSQRNRLVLCDCVNGMESVETDSIPLTVTSPPYDNLRIFSGSPWDFEVFKRIARQLYRITAPGGVVCWVVQDQVIKGGLTGTKMRQALFFQELGFSISHEITMISKGFRNQSDRRYPNQVQTGFVFSKGKIKTINLIRDRANVTAGTKGRFSKCHPDGRRETISSGHLIQSHGIRTNVWTYKVGGSKTTKDKFAFDAHSAIMPEEMAEDFIVSFSNPGDLVFDPMAGTGTTCKMAWLNFRDYLGFEIWEQAYLAAVERLALYRRPHLTAIDDILARGILQPLSKGIAQ